MIPNRATISAIGPEISPRDQSNSRFSGKMRMPVTPIAPEPTMAVRKVSATITHP